jgi:two-component system phosphate regulon sensor histidine kinase PhoR
VANDGTALADSGVRADQLMDMDNHRDRLEIREALSSGSGSDRRRSETTGEMYIYHAAAAGDVVVRGSYPLSRHYALLSKIKTNILLSLLVAGVIALAAGIAGTRRVTRPIRRLIDASRAFRSGGWASYPTEGASEILELSDAMREYARAQAAMMEELTNERNQLGTIVRNAPCGLMLLDSAGNIICVNSAFAPLMRGSPEKSPGAHFSGELRSPELISMITEAKDGRGAELGFVFHHAGAEIFYKARVVPVGAGELLAVLDDETERKKMESARKAFVADAGHEFQTPLTVMSAAAELLSSMDGSTAPERAPYIEEIMRQRERMTAMVDDLLFLSRLESGAPRSESEKFDLSETLSSLMDDAMKNPLASKIEWTADIAARVPFFGRRTEIRRAVSNLLDNAVKYVRKRYKEDEGGRISVSLKSSESGLVLLIADNGTGIPPGKLGAIFGRFVRGEDDRQRDGAHRGGYGLGLAIAKHAAESHGGRIEAASAPDSTVFTVTLPAAPKD